MNKEVGTFARIAVRSYLTRLPIFVPAAERRRPPTQRCPAAHRQANRNRDEFVLNTRLAFLHRRLKRKAVVGDGFSLSAVAA
jgi:hypothetical protein